EVVVGAGRELAPDDLLLKFEGFGVGADPQVSHDERHRELGAPMRRAERLPSQSFDRVDLLDDARGEDLVPAVIDENVVLDANTDAAKLEGHALGVRSDIEARLDGQHHPWGERSGTIV